MPMIYTHPFARTLVNICEPPVFETREVMLTDMFLFVAARSLRNSMIDIFISVIPPQR